MIKLWWLQTSNTWSWALGLPALVAVIVTWSTVSHQLRWNPEVDPTPLLLPVFETVAPLLAVFMLPRLTAGEIEASRLELLFSYPQKRWLFLLRGLAGVALALAVGLALPALFVHICFNPVDFTLLLENALPPLLAVGAAALAVATLTNSTISGYLAGGAWWFLELTTRGQYSGDFFLFAASIPRPDLSDFDLAKNRLILTVIGLVMLSLSFVLIQRKQRLS